MIIINEMVTVYQQNSLIKLNTVIKKSCKLESEVSELLLSFAIVDAVIVLSTRSTSILLLHTLEPIVVNCACVV